MNKAIKQALKKQTITIDNIVPEEVLSAEELK